VTTARSCSNCQFWRRKRPDSNWGVCTLLSSNEGAASDIHGRLAHTWSQSMSHQFGLDTRDIFYCAHFLQRSTPEAKPVLLRAGAGEDTDKVV
jgi:hypothetical protein